jgi:hypothetical protein
VTKKKQTASNPVATADGIDCLTDALDGYNAYGSRSSKLAANATLHSKVKTWSFQIAKFFHAWQDF